MAAEEDNAGNVKRQLEKLFEVSLRAIVPDGSDVVEPKILAGNGKFDDYQCENAIGLWHIIKGRENMEYNGPQSVGEAMKKNVPNSNMIESMSVAGPGFVNVVLSKEWMAKSIKKMLVDGINTWAPRLENVERVLVDFPSPNIAKEMHAGHLRPSIIGETIARTVEFSNVEVLRRNHVGDWGTQFGMLIEFLFENSPNEEEVEEEEEEGVIPEIGDLQALYKAARKRFKDDDVFKKKAQEAVVHLQSGVPRYRNAWLRICEISRREYQRVFERLGVRAEEKGESFYNPYIPRVLQELSDKELIKESEGASVIHLEGFEIGLIVVKRDGGYNYACTDLAALHYRINVEKADWIIYVTDVGQKQHFGMVFKAAKNAGWLPNHDDDALMKPKVTHAGFGLVQGNDGKRIRSSSGDTIRLVDLLDEAKKRAKEALLIKLAKRANAQKWTEEELDQTAEAIGYSAVKYADLKNNRLTDYKFDFDQLLNDKGNTAVYLLYAHARICAIIRRSGRDMNELKLSGEIVLDHPGERELGLRLLQFSESVEETCTTLFPNVLCDYLYKLSEAFTKSFYTNCQVVGSPEETSRLLLCEATAIVMRKCFSLLGIEPIYRI